MKLDYRDVVKRVQMGEVNPVYFLNGNDFYLQDYFVLQVENALQTKYGTISKVSLMPTSGETSGILNDLQTIPMFPEPILFIIRNPLVFKGKAQTDLLDYCKSPNSNNFLILITDEIDGRKKLNKLLANTVGLIYTSPPLEYKMNGWIKFLFKQAGLNATEQAVERLQELAGDTVYHAANEIEKITLSVENGSSINEEEILRYAGWNRDYSPADFQDAIGSRDYKKAHKIGGKLLEGGVKISALIGYMTTLFQEINFRNFSKNGKKAGNGELWLSNSVRKKMPQYQALYSKEEIKSIFRLLIDADKDIKNSASEYDRILFSLFYKIVEGNG
ncbi:MAG: DNA polymerase III subunit delta [Candidatus Marinimicrobia bacterium]|jgi:DNA polymerase-3 subunit delta|nr:DNA polymerase III subunit delta [Candidatus Neomarinimicrobiota bacterium]MDP6568899.1 DNA polymerase III subunit delta [Candidatus Neomarinimicrobiota bacterium]MDP7025418.1 DNA polymerase III subunit delta [Candidatus Neomarinimicrobiota bacterium]|tara:strand:+ start:2283 stop:3275 length:993 start_codon:yes stop_codon:yes gene_type:complete